MCGTTDSHNLRERCAAYDPADIDDAIAQIKMLCELSRSPLVRQRCLSAILALRSRQHSEHMEGERVPFPRTDFAGAFPDRLERETRSPTPPELPARGDSAAFFIGEDHARD